MIKKRKTKGLVISGGGAYGAMGVGTLARMNKSYQHIGGVSTGALMSPLVALKEWNILKEAYTSVSQEDIIDKSRWFEPSTFHDDGKVNILNLLYKQVKGDISAGSSNALRETIDKFITEEQFEKIKSKKISLAVGAQNLRQNPSKIHYFDINDKNYDHNDFKDWMWASANAPIFLSLLNKQWYDKEDDRWYDGQWTDGGLTQPIALDYLARQKKCDEIDVIIHKEKPRNEKQIGTIKDLTHNAKRCFDALLYDTQLEYLPYEIMKLNQEGVSVRVIWLSRNLADNSLIFNKETMENWYQEGYDTALDKNRVDEYLV